MNHNELDDLAATDKIGKGINDRSDLAALYPTPKAATYQSSYVRPSDFDVIRRLVLFSSLAVVIPFVASTIISSIFTFGAIAGVFLSFAVGLIVFGLFLMIYQKIKDVLYSVTISPGAYLLSALVLLFPYGIVLKLLNIHFGALDQAVYLVIFNFIIIMTIFRLLLTPGSSVAKFISYCVALAIINGLLMYAFFNIFT